MLCQVYCETRGNIYESKPNPVCFFVSLLVGGQGIFASLLNEHKIMVTGLLLVSAFQNTFVFKNPSKHSKVMNFFMERFFAKIQKWKHKETYRVVKIYRHQFLQILSRI